MFHIDQTTQQNKTYFYNNLMLQAEGLMEGESDYIANMANLSSLLFLLFEDVNWAGFYLMKEEQLVLGPFQGKPACIRIQLGRGVCGTAAMELRTQVVPDVHLYPGHIACDGETNSEIVVPMIQNGSCIGVLDMDSPVHGKFDEIDRVNLELLVALLIKQCFEAA